MQILYFECMNKLGIDFGKVIISPTVNGVADTSFLGSSLEAAMKTPAAKGAFEAVKALVDSFQGQVWIVSKCGPSVEKKSRAWLEHWDFYERTGVSPDNLRFCRKRPDKAPICRSLGINHFIDDRLDVLSPMRNDVKRLFLFGEQRKSLRIPNWAEPVENWAELLSALSLTNPGIQYSSEVHAL